MPTAIERNAATILSALYNHPQKSDISGQQISEVTGLSPDDINDAVAVLVESGMAEWLQTLGTHPYMFMYVTITPRGKIEYQRINEQGKASSVQQGIIRPPVPAGSPYGFQEEDWEIVIQRRIASDKLYVSFGYQFKSTHYITEILVSNIQWMFDDAISSYNRLPGKDSISIEFTPLAAGYGEHLFNQIARDIISSDIAVFDTSDKNPNVMLEMGVALTWGVRVLPIKEATCEKPPSDISGQTWADYSNNGEVFEENHQAKLVAMIDRAMRKKLRQMNGV